MASRASSSPLRCYRCRCVRYNTKAGKGSKVECSFANPVVEQVQYMNERLVGTQNTGYVRNVPLPRVPLRQSPRTVALPDYYEDQYGVPTYVTPRSLVESAAYAFSPAWQAIAINS